MTSATRRLLPYESRLAERWLRRSRRNPRMDLVGVERKNGPESLRLTAAFAADLQVGLAVLFFTAGISAVSFMLGMIRGSQGNRAARARATRPACSKICFLPPLNRAH